MMQGSQSRNVSLKQAEEEVLLKAGDAGSSTFLPFDTDLTSQQRAAFRCVLRSSLVQWHASLITGCSSFSALDMHTHSKLLGCDEGALLSLRVS